MSDPPTWDAISSVEQRRVLLRIQDGVVEALYRAERWATRVGDPRFGDGKRTLTNAKANLRKAEARYAALRRLDRAHWWPDYEERLAKLRAMIPT